MPHRLIAGAFLALVASLPVAAEEAPATDVFGSVRVACAPDDQCVAVVPSGETGGAVTSVLQIGRTARPDARWTLAVSTLVDLADRTRPASLAVEGGLSVTLAPGTDYAPFVNPGDFYVTAQGALDRLMPALLDGRSLRFAYIDIAGGPHTETYPLDGLTAALAEIDRRQGRGDGDRRAAAPRDLPPAAVVDPAELLIAAGVPPRLADWHAQSSSCETVDTPALSTIAPVIGALSSTAMLYAIPCHTRADRPVYRLYVIESGEIGGMDTLVFALWSKRFGWRGSDTLEAVTYDAAERRLTATDLGGGPEGCGVLGRWIWEDYAFRLEEMRAPSACGRGDPARWPVVFPPRS